MKDHRPTAPPDLEWMSHEGPAPITRSSAFSRVRLPFLAVHLLVLFGAQTALLLAFVARQISPIGFVGIHLGLCAASAMLGWLWLRLARRGGQLGTVLQVSAWTAVAGPFGPVVAAALLVPQGSRPIETGAPAPLTLSLEEQMHGSLLDRRLRIEQAHRVPALADVFIAGSQIEKFNALRLISKHYDPAMAPALRRALADRDGSVRVLAATVMAQQQNRFTKRIGALQSAAKARPETARQWSDLGCAHFDYARSNLLERPRADTELRDALACLIRAEQLAPRDAAVLEQLKTIRRFAIDGNPAPGDAPNEGRRMRQDVPHAG